MLDFISHFCQSNIIGKFLINYKTLHFFEANFLSLFFFCDGKNAIYKNILD